MITDGWILPDGEEIACSKFASNDWYLSTVNKYLSYIKKEDPICYKIINVRILMFSLKVYHFSLQDFAVLVLGWTKVGSFPYRHIQTAGYEFQQKLRKRYMDCGFTDNPPSVIFSESTFLKIDTPVDTNALFD